MFELTSFLLGMLAGVIATVFLSITLVFYIGEVG